MATNDSEDASMVASDREHEDSDEVSSNSSALKSGPKFGPKTQKSSIYFRAWSFQCTVKVNLLSCTTTQQRKKLLSDLLLLFSVFKQYTEQ